MELYISTVNIGKVENGKDPCMLMRKYLFLGNTEEFTSQLRGFFFFILNRLGQSELVKTGV